MRFRNRSDAGARLAELVRRVGLLRPVVLGLPRGGVPVASEVAKALSAPLDVFVARKIGAPDNPELGIGAIAEGGGVVLNTVLVQALSPSIDELDRRVAQEREELNRRVEEYRGGRPAIDVSGRDVVLVDDGLATGVTARAALRALRARQPRRLVLAVPVAAIESADALADEADDIVALISSNDFFAVGSWYADFTQVTDDEVRSLMAEARAPDSAPMRF